MHYRNGREAKIGDIVLYKPEHGVPIVGVIVKIQPGCNDCNATLAPLAQTLICATLNECVTVDDATQGSLPSSNIPEVARPLADKCGGAFLCA